MYQRLDKENMFSAIWDFPENLSDALEIGNSIKLNQKYDNIQGVVIAGMGGSAIGGDVISVLEKTISLFQFRLSWIFCSKLGQ